MGIVQDIFDDNCTAPYKFIGSKRSFLAFVGCSEAKLDSITELEIMATPCGKRYGLVPQGGRVRFPGSSLQDVRFSFAITKQGRSRWNQHLPEGIGGTGQDWRAGAVSALVGFWDLLMLRRAQAGWIDEVSVG